MLHVLTTLLATALLTCSTGAKAVKNNENQKQEINTAFRAEPKRAFYDPTDNYGTTAGTFYNYSSLEVEIKDTSGSQHIETILPNESYKPNYNVGYVTVKTGLGNLYKNGVFDKQMGYGQSTYETYDMTAYYWVFDVDAVNYTAKAENGTLIQNGAWGAWNTSQFTNKVNITSGNTTAQVSIYIALPEGLLTPTIIGEGEWTITETSTGNMPEGYAKYLATATLGRGTYEFFVSTPVDPEAVNENIFEAVGDTITGLSDALASPWEGILNIFYDTTENEVTQMGYLVLIGLGVSITLLVFWTILRLFKQRN